ncbi:MAG TPA: thioesterase family protein [Blastocatellia bacterium]|nr:thioesterase family protein [Blastocatellia bacterium]
MSYTTRIPVRFGDVDKAGIVYYPVIFHYLHVAQEDFFAEYVGVPYHRLIEEENLGFPTVSDSTEFYRPFKYGEVVAARVHISRVGGSSVTFEFRLFVDGSDELRVRSSQVKVSVDMETWRKVPVPEKYRAVFRECSGE